jgi:hypothetical protein
MQHRYLLGVMFRVGLFYNTWYQHDSSLASFLGRNSWQSTNLWTTTNHWWQPWKPATITDSCNIWNTTLITFITRLHMCFFEKEARSYYGDLYYGKRKCARVGKDGMFACLHLPYVFCLLDMFTCVQLDKRHWTPCHYNTVKQHYDSQWRPRI